MKCENAPAEVSDLLPFQCSINSTYVSRASEAAFAGISKNGLWMWIIHDTTINIYHTENSEWFGGYCFGESLKNPSAKITAVSEFPSSHITFPCLLIAVNNDHESLICMYNVNTSKVVRSVLIPDRVLSIEVISGNGGACMDTHHLYMQLRYMFGIIALGTSSGHVYFLDLCLDEDFPCDENLPNITYVINKYELKPERRERAISKQQHIFILLNDQSTRSGSFELESRSSSLGHYPYGKAHVTALKYIPSTVTLAVGFSFGGAQLWNLQDLCLLYTFAYDSHQPPVITFAFQEPENDPRNFCYLWIIRGFCVNERPDEASVAVMYSLTYSKRTYVESYGNLYMDMQNCNKRFEYTLTSDPVTSAQSSSFSGSCVLSCQTVCQTDELHALDATSMNDSDTAPENMSLCFLSWLVWSDSGNSPTSYHFALFDLNQWYQAQMPASNYRSDPSDLNPFLAHFSLGEVVQKFDEEPLLGMYVVPHNIRKFKYISPAEEFFYPSSLDFQTVLYSSHAICKAAFLGLQKSLLYEIAEMGPNVLINPKEFYSDLIQYGLVPDPTGIGERVPLITQREMILQLALEYHLPYFFMKCLKEWRYADSIQEGCTSRALLNWSWKKVSQIKSGIDKLNVPFFNCSGLDIDKANLKCLYSYRRQLNLIDTILMGYQKFAAPRTEQGIQELKCKKDVVFSINMYLQVILWLRSVHILPEVNEGEESDKNVLYPVSALINSYDRRRNDIKNIHSSVSSTDILLIDGLVKEAFSENTWQEKGGNGIYPPPSIYAALSCYLLDGVHLDLKHSLMYYLLLDICYSSPKNPYISEVKKFPAVFEMSQSVAKLVKAFWCLDQLKFEVAIKKLLHPAVKASDILPWQHHRVIKSFLFRGEAQKALRYINHMDPPENTLEDMKLHLSVLLARGAIIQAFEYQRSKQAEGFGKELLNHLFLGCQETHKLKDLMYMPLNALESSSLVKFLSENDDPCAQEALVMYYLLRCNFFEAAKVNEKLAISLSGKTLSTNERTAGRDALVEGLLSSVPKTEKNLVNEINRFPCMPIRKGDVELKPLSLSVKSAPLKQISYSDILNSLITDANSAMCAPYLEPQTPLKTSIGSNFDSIPFLRPPLAPEFTRPLSETATSTPVIKRALVSPSSEFSSPTKKSRLLDNAAFRTSSLMKRKIPKHLAGDVASLLQSPPIHRRGSKLSKDGNAKDSSTVPPQGILKKKVEPSKFSVSDLYTSRTPSVLSDAMESDDDDEAVDSEKMIVEDEIVDDVPGRQIRFSVPPKEDLNASMLSTSDAESSILSMKDEPAAIGVSNQPTVFVKKIDSMKNTSLKVSVSDREFINVTRRKSLFSLTREPLKSHAKESSETLVFASKSENVGKMSSEFSTAKNSDVLSSTCVPSSSLKDSKMLETSVDTITSDNLPDVEDVDKIISSYDNAKPIQNEINSELVQASKYSLSSSTLSNLKMTTLSREPVVHLSSTESDLNRSGSSSGNSSYNSASERSLIITPRRPLRDNSRNVSTSDTSMISAVEEKMDDTLIDAENEKHDDDDDAEIIDEISNEPCVKEYDDIDVKIIHEVLCHPDKETISDTEDITSGEKSDDSDIKIIEELTTEQVKQTESSEKSMIHIQKSASVDISVTRGTSVQSVEEMPVYQILSNISECSSDNSVKKAKEMESNLYIEETINNQNQNIAQKNDSNTNTEEELSSQTDGMEVNASKNIPSVPETNSHVSLAVDSEHVTQPSHVGNFDVSSSNIDVYDFPKDTASASGIPAYVPIRERIGRTAHKHTSEFQIYENVEDMPDSSFSELTRKQIGQSLKEDVTEDKTSNLAKQHTTTDSLPELPQDHGSVTKVSSDEAMETEQTEESESAEYKGLMSTPTSTPSREYFTERFDFLSKNSDMYENSKLYKEAMNILKENDISQNVELYGGKSSRQTKTFVFSKEKAMSFPKSAKKASQSEDSNSIFDDERTVQKEFLEAWNPGTYEQFSSSITKDGSDVSQNKNLRSSPNAGQEKSSASDKIDEIEHQIPETKGKTRKQDSSRKDSSFISKKSPIRKAKGKGKLTRKMEFSFAEPHSPAGPEILEALTSSPERPVGSFMFSPPLTRGRLRQKKLDETFGSSFASIASETSFGRTKKPPVDPILEGIIAERSEDPKKPEGLTPKSKTKSSKKKTAAKKSRIDLPQLESLDSSLDVSKLVDVSQDLSTSKVLSSAKYTGKHTMVLRQAKVKPRKEQLF